MRISLCILPLIAAHVVAQIPSPVSTLRAAPRAGWSLVASVQAGTIPQRADQPGAASNDKLYLFGGCSGNNTATTLNDLWEFDGTNATQLNPTGPVPLARGRHSFAFNNATGKLVLFGGDTRGTTNLILGDIWEYDPTANTWTDVTPTSGPMPIGRRWAGMAWDPTTTGMLLYGGNDPVAGNLDDTWLFLAGTWVPLSPSNVPPSRSQAQLCTRPDFGDVFLVGGTTDAASGYWRHDAWSWNGSDWTLLNPGVPGVNSFKAAGAGNQAVYDPLRKRIVIQGGNGIGANSGSPSIYSTALGNEWGGSPSQYTSEFDCLTNEWVIYANPQGTVGTTFECNRNDPVIGRVSRYSVGFIPSLGKIYMMAGQNVAQSNSYQRSVFEYQATPVAAATSFGAGCTGSGGPMTLVADSLPWSGRTYQTTGSGFPAGALGAAAIGFASQSVPLASLHPAGGAGCDLLVNNVSVVLLLPTAGQAALSLGIPNTTVFAGLVIRTQMLCVELDALGNITALTSTNGLAATVGAL